MHRRAKLTVLGRRLLVERILGQGWPVVVAAQAKAFRGHGLQVAAALARRGCPGAGDRSSRPRHSPRRLPTAREQAIVSCRLRSGSAPPYRLDAWRGAIHGARGLAPPAAAAAVGARRPTGQVVRYQRQRPGELIMSMSRSKAGSLMVVGIGCLAGPAATETDATGWATTCCMWRWMTAPAGCLEVTPTNAARRRLSSPPGRLPGSPGSGSPWSGS